MNRTLELSTTQTSSVEETKQAFSDLSSAISKMTEALDAMHHNINQMEEDRAIVVDAISHMSTVATDSAAATEQMNASVDEQKKAIESIMQSALELQDEAEEMNKLVKRFT